MQDPPASVSLVLGFQMCHHNGLKAAHILLMYVWPQFKILNVFKVVKQRKTEWVAPTLGFDLSTMDFSETGGGHFTCLLMNPLAQVYLLQVEKMLQRANTWKQCLHGFYPHTVSRQRISGNNSCILHCQSLWFSDFHHSILRSQTVLVLVQLICSRCWHLTEMLWKTPEETGDSEPAQVPGQLLREGTEPLSQDCVVTRTAASPVSWSYAPDMELRAFTSVWLRNTFEHESMVVFLLLCLRRQDCACH